MREIPVRAWMWYIDNLRKVNDKASSLVQKYLTKNGVPFAYLDEVVLQYRLSGVSGAGHYSEAFMRDMFVIYDQFIFPYDRRFGPLQGIYNLLKRHGLQFYQARARWSKLSPGKRIWYRIRYAPFYALTALQNGQNRRKNRKNEKGAG